MWTAKNRKRYDRSKLRYPSDLTDDEWVHVEPLIPSAKRGGNRRHVDVLVIRDHVCFEYGMPVAGDPERPAGTQHAVRLSRPMELGRHAGSHPSARFMWSAASKANAKPAPPPPSSMSKRKVLKKGGLVSIRMAMMQARRSKAEAPPSRIRWVLLLHAIVHPADIQDRDGGVTACNPVRNVSLLEEALCRRWLSGPDFQKALAKITPHLTTEIVKRSIMPRICGAPTPLGRRAPCSAAQPLQSSSRSGPRCTALAFLRLASIRLMLRKLCNPARCSRTDS